MLGQANLAQARQAKVRLGYASQCKASPGKAVLVLKFATNCCVNQLNLSDFQNFVEKKTQWTCKRG
jgi:hypothetical protein